MQEHCDQAKRVELHEKQEDERQKKRRRKKQYKNRMEYGASIDATETLLFTPTKLAQN